MLVELSATLPDRLRMKLVKRIDDLIAGQRRKARALAHAIPSWQPFAG